MPDENIFLADALLADDKKLVTLARSSRSRVGAAEGAAVRDETGRTYVSTTVRLASLHLSALQSAVAQAVAAGATGIQAAAIVTTAGEADAAGVDAVRDLGGVGVPILIADVGAEVRAVAST